MVGFMLWDRHRSERHRHSCFIGFIRGIFSIFYMMEHTGGASKKCLQKIAEPGIKIAA